MKTSKNVNYMCATGGLWGIHHFFKIPEVLLFPLPEAICVPQSLAPLIGPLAAENCVARHFDLPFRSLMYKKKFSDTCRSSWPDDSNHTSFGSLRLSWAEQSSFKDAKTICEELSGARNRQEPLGLFFAALNSYCSAQDRWRAETGMVRTVCSWGSL